VMSALGGKADIERTLLNVRLYPKQTWHRLRSLNGRAARRRPPAKNCGYEKWFFLRFQNWVRGVWV